MVPTRAREHTLDNCHTVVHPKHRTMFSWSMNIFYPNRRDVLQCSTHFLRNSSWDGATTLPVPNFKPELVTTVKPVELAGACTSPILINPTRFLAFQEHSGHSGERRTSRTPNNFIYQEPCWDIRPLRTNAYVLNVVTLLRWQWE